MQALLAGLKQRWAAYSTGRSQGEKRAISRNEYGVPTFMVSPHFIKITTAGVNTRVSLQRGGPPFLVGGPPYRNGVLIIAISAR